MPNPSTPKRGKNHMASTNLPGPFALTDAQINSTVTKVSPGAYALGRVDENGVFLVERVGRSDYDLNNRLHDYVGKYPSFKADYFPSAAAAFHKECQLFHDFRPTDNDLHPDRPNGLNLRCLHCPEID